MAIIRIQDLPNEANPSASDEIAIDGTATRKTTLEKAVSAGRPVATQPEAEAGVNNTKTMTPLTTKQAIDAIGGAKFATTAEGSKANTALQPANIGTTVQAHDALLDSVSSLSLTAGDLLYATGANTVARLPIGSEGQVLANVGGTPAYKTVPAVDLPDPAVANTVPVRNGGNTAYEAKPVGTTGLALLEAETANNARAAISAQESDANLNALSSLTFANGKFPVFTDATTAEARDIIGTVSQTGGVPTGAIIEQGSNANGKYVKFADGTLICWQTKSISVSVTTAWGALYVSSPFAAGDFPHAFSTTPETFICTREVTSGSSNPWVLPSTTAPTTTKWGSIFVANGPSVSPASARLSLMAIGRWF